MRVKSGLSIAAVPFVSIAMMLGVCIGQEPAPSQDPSEQAEDASRPNASEKLSFAEPKPYEKVITKEAKTKQGVFAVHQVKQRWYYEIPKSELNKEFLWVVQFAGVPAGMDRGERPRPRVVRWELQNNKMYLREMRYEMVAAATEPIAKAVEASNSSAIHVAFNVEAWGPNDTAVIDVTSLFTSDMKELGPSNIGKVDRSRSFLQRIATFPANVEVEASVTATDTVNTIPPAPGAPPGKATITATYIVHTSMVKLPEKPIMARLFDDRVGFFTLRKTDFGLDEQKAARRQYIARWRLEKKDPTAAISEPVKPIVYYIDPATPKKWVPYIKEAVESWQVAFEEAGFKKAIVAKEAPTPEEDPEWSAEDVRNTIIRWLPSTTANARGPHIADPRSGEILNGSIIVYHNILDLMRSMYFVQVSPLDVNAQKLPLPDDLMGKLLGYVIKHEVGHTLGLRHNMKASSMYPAEKMRDREWIRKMGHTPSLMDYSRFNYVAQPEDGFDPADLIPGIGPYDKWAISWGYKPIEGAKSPDDEKRTLDQWSREQEKQAYLRFADDAAVDRGFDPGEATEAVGDANAVWSTELGLKNLERVSNMLLTATTTQVGEPYDDLRSLNKRLLSQWATEMGHVIRIVGGISTHNKHVGQEGTVYEPVSSQRQREAVKFLNENAFVAPRFLLNPEIVNRLDPNGAPGLVADAQAKLMMSLLSAERIERLQNLESVNGPKSYRPLDFTSDVHSGIWKELAGGRGIKIDGMRRNLQRAYVDHLGKQMQSPKAANVRAFFRGELARLRTQIKSVLPGVADPVSRAHLSDIQDQISQIFDAKGTGSAVSSTRSTQALDQDLNQDQMEDFSYPPVCWPHE